MLQAGRSGVRTSVEAKFYSPVQTGPKVQPTSCTVGVGCLMAGGGLGNVFRVRISKGTPVLPSVPSWQFTVELYLLFIIPHSHASVPFVLMLPSGWSIIILLRNNSECIGKNIILCGCRHLLQ